MKKEILLEELKNIGFNEYKAKVFIALSGGKIMSASEIVEEAKIIRDSIYDILKNFVSKGYCNEIETNRILMYQIIDPEIILDKILKDYEESHRNNIEQVKTTFNKINEVYRNTEHEENNSINIELIRGYNKHRIAKYRELLLSAEKEICGMYKFKGLVSDDGDEVAAAFMKNGGKIKSIYQASLDFKIERNGETYNAEDEDLVNVLEQFQKNGEEIRLSEKDIPNVTIIDNENVFINTEDKWVPRQSQADIILRKSNFSKYLMDLFEHYWNNSLTIEQYKIKIEQNYKIPV